MISAQVLGEFYATITGKLEDAVTPSIGRAMVEQMTQLPVVPLDVSLIQEAISGCETWRISYWDSLIVAAAHVAGCRILISEDLTDGATYGSVRVENPFRDR